MMKKNINFCGIFAIMFVAAIIFSVSSCSEDDQHLLSLLEKAETYLPEKPDSAEMCFHLQLKIVNNFYSAQLI